MKSDDTPPDTLPAPAISRAQRLGIKVSTNRARDLGLGSGASGRAARLGIGSALASRAARLGLRPPEKGTVPISLPDDQEESA